MSKVKSFSKWSTDRHTSSRELKLYVVKLRSGWKMITYQCNLRIWILPIDVTQLTSEFYALEIRNRFRRCFELTLLWPIFTMHLVLSYVWKIDMNFVTNMDHQYLTLQSSNIWWTWLFSSWLTLIPSDIQYQLNVLIFCHLNQLR